MTLLQGNRSWSRIFEKQESWRLEAGKNDMSKTKKLQKYIQSIYNNFPLCFASGDACVARVASYYEITCA
jgi:hypothetical protein